MRIKAGRLLDSRQTHIAGYITHIPRRFGVYLLHSIVLLNTSTVLQNATQKQIGFLHVKMRVTEPVSTKALAQGVVYIKDSQAQSATKNT